MVKKLKVSSDKVLELERKLSSLTDLNPVQDLLTYLESDSVDGRVKHKTLFVLQRVFSSLLVSDRILGLKSTSDNEAITITKKWLLDKYTKFFIILGQLLYSNEHSLRITSLHISMSLIRTESSYISNKTKPATPQFAIESFRRLVRSLLVSEKPIIDDVRKEWIEKWPGKCDDIRYFFFKETISLLREFDIKNESRPKYLTANVLSILENIHTMPTDQSEIDEFWVPEIARQEKEQVKQSNLEQTKLDSQDWTAYYDQMVTEEDEEKATDKNAKKSKVRDTINLSAHRAMYSGVWLTLLKCPTGLDVSENRRALVVLHQLVIPFLKPSERASLADWLSDCCDIGGVNALLALNSLWRLMRDHNLDYPDFYRRLYALCDRNVLHVLYRARFFRMLDLFLSSTHLPALLVAAFIKRLSRLSISASPAAIVMLIPFTYNLLKRHPGCMHLIHSERMAQGEEADMYKVEETDPMLSNALDSSLWEMSTHQSHYHSSVNRMSQIFSQVFSKPNFAMEEFLDHAYITMFDSEIRRRIKNNPALYDGKTIGIFGGHKRKLDSLETDEEKDAVSGTQGDLVAELFEF
ncbi:CBF-domain-containing protein [Wallemia mellicola]|nr:CBF-domain-containing protein [Wallemia mellicola]TIB91411.1 CBF-domain-containing protein [Wallemia mellicola]TIC42841.1 CBF-domain-containing protein [Wallemia mellicola]TIC51650.1 CBF-domain-containing protein [Wallemia mellicola]